MMIKEKIFSHSSITTSFVSSSSSLPVYPAEFSRFDEAICPSFCDDNGAKQTSFECHNSSLSTLSLFCCNYGKRLECCHDNSLKISSSIQDGYLCSTLGSYILSVCVPVGFVCFVGIVVLAIYQRMRRRNINTQIDETRARTASNASSSSQFSSSLPASSSSSFRQQQRQNYHQQQSEIEQQTVVIATTTTNLQDDDIIHRLQQMIGLQTLPTTTMPTLPTATTTETCFIIQSSTLSLSNQPPPYTSERPPSYNDIFPS